MILVSKYDSDAATFYALQISQAMNTAIAETSKTASFIQGRFRCAEAKALLQEIYGAKIRFHQQKLFDGAETEQELHFSAHRIVELQQAMRRMLAAVDDTEDGWVTLSADIHVVARRG